MKIMHQSWGKLLFMHWPIAADLLRPLIPQALEIETYDGSAWIAIVPFTMWDIRPLPPYMPSVPGLAAMHELNVRTYVQFDREPGVWFFSLDCNSRVAVLAARTSFFLPYFNANIELKQEDKTISYHLERTDEPTAAFSAGWEILETLPTSEPGSLEFFLTERYCLYSARKDKIYRARIRHQPWPLRRANLGAFESTMLEVHGLQTPNCPALLHYAEEVNVDIWPLERA